ncbi:hypothetical protein SDC9_117466 [bioreactor metagenome]|uniref:Aminoglycoside phosphotransferase domain-containing protein n=1 Tax=bioreactor metagenome TaxID=1076179 RepID=A0A645C0Q8_9ZZZZ
MLDSDIQKIVDILNNNLFLLYNRPQCFNHGDYNPGNLILLADETLVAIDFNNYNLGYGDPEFELGTILFDNDISDNFKNGFIYTYFSAGLPDNFYSLMNFYYIYGFIADLCECDTASNKNSELISLILQYNYSVKDCEKEIFKRFANLHL